MLKGLMIWVCALGFIPVCAAPGSVTVLWNTFTPTDTYNTTSPWWQYTAIRDNSFFPSIVESTAMAFTTPGQLYELSAIELGVTHSAVFTSNVLHLELCDDASGVPGALIEAFTLDGQVPLGGPGDGAKPPLVATSALNPILQPNTQYWVTMSVPPNPNNRVYNYWWENDIGFTGLTGRMVAPASSWTTAVGPQSAFRVSATNVPEPLSAFPVIAFVLFVCRRCRV